MRMTRLIAAATLALGFTAGAAQAADIVDTAAGAGQFNTLIAAAKAAGLVGALKGSGPLTVFAPTDAAFAKLPKGTVENLLKPENRDQLVAVLTYHVLPRKLTANMLPAGRTPVRSLNTQARTLHIVNAGGGVRVDNARVLTADVITDNGVIHIVDTVLLPKAKSATRHKSAVRHKQVRRHKSARRAAVAPTRHTRPAKRSHRYDRFGDPADRRWDGYRFSSAERYWY